MLKLPYSAPTACVGWLSDKASLLLNYTWGGRSCILVTMSFVVVLPVGGGGFS